MQWGPAALIALVNAQPTAKMLTYFSVQPRCGVVVQLGPCAECAVADRAAVDALAARLTDIKLAARLLH